MPPTLRRPWGSGEAQSISLFAFATNLGTDWGFQKHHNTAPCGRVDHVAGRQKARRFHCFLKADPGQGFACYTRPPSPAKHEQPHAPALTLQARQVRLACDEGMNESHHVRMVFTTTYCTGAGLCILSSPPSEGHLAFVVYIPNGGVLHGLQASRALLLPLRCVHIPCPTGDLVISWANHGCIRCSLILDTC